MPDDDQLIRTAARLTRELGAARPGVYWTDLLLSVGIGYGALALAILAAEMPMTSALHRANHRGMSGLLIRLFGGIAPATGR
jgi:hypothetical protein